MFDIGFAELIIIGVVALLVIGPERLPATVRTVSLYVNRIRRGFNEIKQEVQRELHNDSVMRELSEAGRQLQEDTDAIGRDLDSAAEKLGEVKEAAGNGGAARGEVAENRAGEKKSAETRTVETKTGANKAGANKTGENTAE